MTILPTPFFRDRNVFVTGATGLLGSWLCHALCEAGANVVALVRDEVPRSNLHRLRLIAQVTQVRGPLEDFLLLRRTLEEYEVETIFHLGAQTVVGIATHHPLSTFESNIRGTYNLLEAARQSTLVKRVIIASTDKAYGDHGERPYTEDMTLDAVAPYDISKACADQLALAYHRFYALPVVTTRFGNLYGGGDLNWNRIVPGTIRSALRNEPPVIRSNGLFVRDYIYVKDAVHAYGILAEQCARPEVAGQAFNFSDEKPQTVIEITKATLQTLGRADLEPVIQNGAIDELPYQALSATRAHDLLGWKPRHGQEQGLAETVAWYQDFFKETA